jgi:hypothetical protein
MPHAIRLRDVTRAHVFELGPEERVLRVPYDLFRPDGPARLSGTIAEWLEGGLVKTGRVVSTRLGETHPGERVLLRDSARPSAAAKAEAADNEWWLCEVEAVGGSTQNS